MALHHTAHIAGLLAEISVARTQVTKACSVLSSHERDMEKLREAAEQAAEASEALTGALYALRSIAENARCAVYDKAISTPNHFLYVQGGIG
jgi:hypothetical protein